MTGTVTKTGYGTAYAIIAGVGTAIGSGLYVMFQPDTPTGQWVGFQIITGVCRGLGFQMV
jgi:multidrug transporter EmrE-like cation transporter